MVEYREAKVMMFRTLTAIIVVIGTLLYRRYRKLRRTSKTVETPADPQQGLPGDENLAVTGRQSEDMAGKNKSCLE